MNIFFFYVISRLHPVSIEQRTFKFVFTTFSVFLILGSSFCCYGYKVCFVTVCCEKCWNRERKRGAKIEKEREGVIKRAAIFRWNVSWQKQNEASAAATAAVTTAVNLWTSLSHERKAIYCISWFTFLVASSICKKKFTKKSFAQTDNGFQSQRTAQLFQ